MSGYRVSGREKRCFAICPSGTHPLLSCPHHLQDGPREGVCSAASPGTRWGALLSLRDEPQVTQRLLGALPSSRVMLAGLSLPWPFPGSQVSAIATLLLLPCSCLGGPQASAGARGLDQPRFRKASPGHPPSKGFSQPEFPTIPSTWRKPGCLPFPA